MNTIIKYGNFDFNGQPTPFLTRSEEFIKNGENWGTKEIFTLRGQLTGCEFNGIRQAQKDLISGFGQDFKNLEIISFESSSGDSNALVSGAGEPFLNRIYVASGLFDGKPIYKYEPNNSMGILFDSGSVITGWVILDIIGAPAYISTGSEDFPWQVSSWGTITGPLPTPVVLESPAFESNILFQKEGLKIDSISFPSNKYVGIIDYEIQLSHFPSDYFQTQWGVIDPVDSWDFTESEDGLLNITHNISCKGFNTYSGANNAFQNARNFVNSRTGYQNMVNPHFICKNTYPNFYPCLDSFSENIDRVRGSYSVTENYISDLNGTGYGVARYTIDINSGINEPATASMRGNIDGCKNMEMDVPRSKFKSLPIFDLVADSYFDSFGSVDLNRTALSSGIEEDQLNKKITFDIVFNNDQSPQTILDYTSNVSSGDSIITVGINGNIKGRGNIFDRFDDISGAYKNISIFDFANTAYVNFLDNNVVYPLNPKAESSGHTVDKYTPQISFAATFTNKEIPPSGFESFNRDISFSPSTRRLKAIPLFEQNGSYDIIDLLFDSRGKINVNLNGVASAGESSESLSSTMRGEANLILQEYGRTESLKLENYTLSTGNQGEYSLTSTWSFETINKVFDGSNYDQVNTLKIK